jgi:hypothetical protein
VARGDHIKVHRPGRFYSHHGIDMGDNTVIHYTEWGVLKRKKGGPKVRRTSLEEFLKGGRRRLVSHKAARCLTIEETCIRAEQAMERKKHYHLMFNNCEHFASYCKTGRAKSPQVRRALALAGIVLGAAALVVARRRKPGDQG